MITYPFPHQPANARARGKVVRLTRAALGATAATHHHQRYTIPPSVPMRTTIAVRMSHGGSHRRAKMAMYPFPHQPANARARGKVVQLTRAALDATAAIHHHQETHLFPEMVLL